MAAYLLTCAMLITALLSKTKQETAPQSQNGAGKLLETTRIILKPQQIPVSNKPRDLESFNSHV